MNDGLWRVGLVLLVSWAVGACGVGYRINLQSRVGDAFGEAQRANVTRMIANPDADRRLTEVTGLDSTTAEGVLTKFRAAQTRAPQPTGPSIIQIGVGRD